MTIIEAEKVLEVSGFYDEFILKENKKKLLKKYHPDNCQRNGFHQVESTRKTQEINEAFALLIQKVEKREKTFFQEQNLSRDKRQLFINSLQEMERVITYYSFHLDYELLKPKYKKVERDIVFDIEKIFKEDEVSQGSYEVLRTKVQEKVIEFEYLIRQIYESHHQFLVDHDTYLLSLLRPIDESILPYSIKLRLFNQIKELSRERNEDLFFLRADEINEFFLKILETYTENTGSVFLFFQKIMNLNVVQGFFDGKDKRRYILARDSTYFGLKLKQEKKEKKEKIRFILGGLR